MAHQDNDQTKLTGISPADGRAVDTLLTSLVGGVPDVAGGGTSERSEKVSRVMSLIGSCPTAPPLDDLVERTMARVRDSQQRQRFAQQIEAMSAPPVRAYWLRELMTVAAVILIGVSLIWPVLDRVRVDARRVACANNLALAGSGFSRYAADNNNTLPRGQVKPGGVWWNVGQSGSSDGNTPSNSAHLYILVQQHYVDAHTLRCPDNPWACNHMDPSMHDWPSAPAVSYSYQNQYTKKPTRLDTMTEMAILADKNPMFTARSGGEAGLAYNSELDPSSPTIFHQRRGQNILTTSGRVMWSTKPIGPNGDNIWLIRGVKDYRGVETPSESDDSFLVP